MSKHILITGRRGAGKSTLVRRLLAENRRPLKGFQTYRLDCEENGYHPIHICPVGERHPVFSRDNLVGTCNSKLRNVFPQVFDTLGASYLQATSGDLIVMDELGFMESDAQVFRADVLKALDGTIPVLAVVKDRLDIAFLNEVRAHPNVQLYTVTEDNREDVFQLLLPQIQLLNQLL